LIKSIIFESKMNKNKPQIWITIIFYAALWALSLILNW
jgi:hypothetical protein